MNNSNQPVRIVLVDDHPMVREGLADVIRREPDLTVCGEAESLHQALEVIIATQADMVLVDLNLKNSHGLDLIKDISIRCPKMRMLVLTMYDEHLYAERVIRAGAHGFITKQEATKNIIAAIRCVLSGQMYLTDSAATQIAKKVLRQSNPNLPGVESFSRIHAVGIKYS